MSAKLDPDRPFQRFPLLPPLELRDRRTRTEDAIVLCHLGVRRIEASEWSLRVDGLVESPLALRFDDLLRYPRFEVASVHQCRSGDRVPRSSLASAERRGDPRAFRGD
jgi:DMSO/TMAO reductase YedYZ molybdopterin-dependent catalytic subunit